MGCVWSARLTGVERNMITEHRRKVEEHAWCGGTKREKWSASGLGRAGRRSSPLAPGYRAASRKAFGSLKCFLTGVWKIPGGVCRSLK